jgi:hypothetical protein
MRFVIVSIIAALGITLAACGGGSALTVHGTVTPSSGASSVFGPGMNATSYAGCSTTRPAPGTQATVTDSSGKVIGNGTLGLWSHHCQGFGGDGLFVCHALHDQGCPQ